MEKLTVREIAAAVGGRLLGEQQSVVESVTTNSREGGGDSLFIAIRGERFDGNDYAREFLDHGRAVLAEREIAPPPGKSAVVVADTKQALLDLARFYRGRFSISVAAVTGSVGKTSTKDMIASVLSQGFSTWKTQGNFNNEIGLPLTLLALDATHQTAVVEMGMNHPGEIRRLGAVARPDVAVITNIGMAHIGNLGSQQNILKAKLEILEKLEPGGLVVLNGDDKILWSLRGKLPHSVLYYGIDNLKADLCATDIVLGNDKSKFKVEIKGRPVPFVVNAIGQHHISNALAAILIGLYRKMDPEDIVRGVAAFVPASMRQSITETEGVRIIDDCYNASPDSMEAALTVLSQLGGAGRTVAVLGDILEQGAFSEAAHRQVGRAVLRYEIKVLVTIGEAAAFIAKEAAGAGAVQTASFETNEQAAQYLTGLIAPGDTVLFKASRGMRLEEVSDALKKHLGSE